MHNDLCALARFHCTVDSIDATVGVVCVLSHAINIYWTKLLHKENQKKTRHLYSWTIKINKAKLLTHTENQNQDIDIHILPSCPFPLWYRYIDLRWDKEDKRSLIVIKHSHVLPYTPFDVYFQIDQYITMKVNYVKH